mgnify:FL=1
MSEHVSKFVDDLSKGHNAEAGEAFKDALRAKVADGLDQARVNIAGKIFSDVEAQPFSDPKPAVTDPSPETETMMGTDGNEIALEPEATANDETQSTT